MGHTITIYGLDE
jgi:hypothetical protein